MPVRRRKGNHPRFAGDPRFPPRAASGHHSQRSDPVSLQIRDRDELVIAELDLDKIREVRNVWQFFRDRRPETYSGICRL